MPKFDHFVVFAEMRTGSNFLEVNINALDGLHCHGEAFNPAFISYPNREETLGVTRAERDADPHRLLDRIKAAEGLNGFRFFNDHDPRVLDEILDDPRCGKVILTRNPVESYVSWKIAQATGQWKLTNVKHAKARKASFDVAEFEAHLDALQSFQLTLLNRLQRTGQSAFYVAYEDLQDVEVMNGLARFLGSEARLDGLDKSLKKQNPAPLEDKVSNFDKMEEALARLDRFNLNRTPNFEPRRGPVVPSYVAAPYSPLLFLPIRGGPEAAVLDWLSGLDEAERDGLIGGFNQKSLRKWKRDRPGHRSFTVLRHPVSRAHAAFCDKILSTAPGAYVEIRKILRQQFKLDIPNGEPDASYTRQRHRTAFLGFLQFVRVNLAGQTSIRVDPFWASQSTVLQGFSDFGMPDMIIREDRMEDDLAFLAAQVGKSTMPAVAEVTDPHAARLAEIYDKDIEQAARDVYARDYMAFGFRDYAA